jgi:hypothetical protein
VGADILIVCLSKLFPHEQEVVVMRYLIVVWLQEVERMKRVAVTTRPSYVVVKAITGVIQFSFCSSREYEFSKSHATSVNVG